MKILVPIKRVPDPHRASELKTQAARVLTEDLDFTINPFDEAAVEAALRLTENGAEVKQRLGEVIVVSLGPADAQSVLRTALACGATRGIHIEADDEKLDARLVAHALRVIALRERPDLILLGRKTVDGEGSSVGPILATMLDVPMVSAATSIVETDDALLVRRHTDQLSLLLRVRLPAVISVDLRVVSPEGTRSRVTASSFEYYDGVRFAALPAVLLARRKPLESVTLQTLLPGVRQTIHLLRTDGLPERAPLQMLSSIEQLAEVLVRHSAPT